LKEITCLRGVTQGVTPLSLEEFAQLSQKRTPPRVKKKELKALAKRLGLPYDAQTLQLSKAMVNAYLAQ